MLAYDVDVQYGGTAPGLSRYGERGHALALGREGRDGRRAVPCARRAVVGAQARHERQQSALRAVANLQWPAACSAQQETNEFMARFTVPATCGLQQRDRALDAAEVRSFLQL